MSMRKTISIKQERVNTNQQNIKLERQRKLHIVMKSNRYIEELRLQHKDRSELMSYRERKKRKN